MTYLLIAAAYLLGSISSAILVCRAWGLPNPRSQGSKNPGATNVKRIGGNAPAAVTLAGDLLKGALPVLIGHVLGLDPLWLMLTGAAAFLGHLYPLFFEFRGGKGVATLLGVLLAFDLVLGLAVAGTWLLVAKGFRLSSLSALIATALAPLYAWMLQIDTRTITVLMFMVALLWWRHRGNIHRLIQGDEDRIRKS